MSNEEKLKLLITSLKIKAGIKGIKMLFQTLATYFQELEETRSRNEMVKILSHLFKEVSGQEMTVVCYLSLGRLKPAYESLEFNLAEKTMAEVIARIGNQSKEEVKKQFLKVGDWGDLVEKIIIDQRSTLDILTVYDQLIKIAKTEGVGSQESKIFQLKSLLSQLDSLSARYVVRIILKKLRLGFSDMTILDALSWMKRGDKSLRNKIEQAYNIIADIGKIAALFKEKGDQGLSKLAITVGIPILPSAAERLASPVKIFEKIGPCLLEPKIDGFRLQVHLNKDRQEKVEKGMLFTKDEPFVRFFSRNLEEMTPMFPELKEVVSKINCQSVIMEGEAVAYDDEKQRFLPFQLTISRKRKYDIQAKSEEVPLTLFVFDLLYLDGEPCFRKPFIERRKRLEKLIPKGNRNLKIMPQQKVDSAGEIANYFFLKKKEGLEGIMAKMETAVYKAGSRGFHWIKYKREEGQGLTDSIDVVVLGYYLGQGKRASFGIGALLVGVYNGKKELFESIAKIGTGIKDEEFMRIKKDCDRIKIKSQPKNVDLKKELFPDQWVEPQIVAVVLADEITRSPLHTAGATVKNKGYALRFPRLLKWNRRDKGIYDITSVSEIEKIYTQQTQICNKSS